MATIIRTSGWGALVLLMWSIGCGQEPTPPWVSELAETDPLFGGGLKLQQILLDNPSLTPAGDASARATYFEDMRARHDDRARARVQRLLDEGVARLTLEFLRGPAGQALLTAEVLALTGHHHHTEEFPRQSAAYFGDRDKVGAAASARFETLRAEVGVGASASPLHLAFVVGAMEVDPASADAISAFVQSGAGARWLAARESAWQEVVGEFQAFRQDALDRGFLAGDELDDLILPSANDDPVRRDR